MVTALPSSMLKEQYEEQGFVIIPGLVEDLEEHRQAAERAIERTRSGSWPHRRVVGKQFPPYGNDDPDSWGVQHVMHPDLGEPVFARWYTSDAQTRVVQELLECPAENLQMELFNMLINPNAHNFALRWHRDDVKETATEEEERSALGVWHYGVQWNTSHRNPRTPDQRKHSSTSEAPKDPMDMPGAIQVTIKAGESVFYNSNILHCAAYDCSQKRATLHATMGDTRAGASRARNILQHGLAWMKEDAFRDTLDEKGKAMLSRLIKMQESVNDDVGYSLMN
ncbi:hypothetical protein NEOLEDRAFT_894387 [Neolentinus lepideus HHB14362 ss-1]|uniref:Phytanoyl-CoA dioxygenase n=1 Tax=Neolentinus lepideus HHB14362 ss-1 TaxID=1314782 RepID=A0A165NSA5_9AGAM|nr:hypothetical protein NEOLEDRAFT_894387 [Neolentinus lepideus HHB14362 ss-1]